MYQSRSRMLRTVYLVTAVTWWLITGLGRLARGRLVVLCYHAVTDAQRTRFRRQMERITSRAIALDGLASGPRSRQSSVAVWVTFDDAFACLLQNALPITAELGIRPTVFAVAGNLGRPPGWRMPPGHPDAGLRTMSREELLDAHRRGLCNVGSHTVTHPHLTNCTPDELQRELATSRQMLQELLDAPVIDLAFPHGAHNDEVADAARRAGYERLLTLEPRLIDSASGRGLVGRFSMSPDAWPAEFWLTTVGAYAWLGPWRKFLRWIRHAFGRPSRPATQTTAVAVTGTVSPNVLHGNVSQGDR